MPYITGLERRALDADIDALVEKIATDGQLNYAITRLAIGRLKAVGLSYAALASVYGTVQMAAEELYRRVVGPYEDKKIRSAGDLPDFLDLTKDGNH